MNTSRKLNLGCGDKPKEGWVNLDIVGVPGVDVVHDMTQIPMPFPDNYFEVIYAEQVLDHFRSLPVIKELHRILKPGGQLLIEVVHFSSKLNYVHLEHVQLYSVDTFWWYIPGTKNYAQSHWYNPVKFSSCTNQLFFEKGSRWFFLNRFIERWVNKSHHRQQMYESTMLCRLFPASNLHIALIK